MVNDILEILSSFQQRLGLAESCTGGLVAATFTSVPGVSEFFCGSAVTYRNQTKHEWLDVDLEPLENPGAVSSVVAHAMSRGVLSRTSEADWSGVITGHLGPNAPDGLDGVVFTSVARRTAKGCESHTIQHQLTAADRPNRQEEACGRLLMHIARALQTQRALNHLNQGNKWASIASSQPNPQLVLAGSFNPLHSGHVQMGHLASSRLACETTFELSIQNVDKPSLGWLEILDRIAEFPSQSNIVISQLPTFVEKSRHWPNATFIVGADTIDRIRMLRYYDNDQSKFEQALVELQANAARFLVFGRRQSDAFISLADLDLPDVLAALCDNVSEAEFRDDVSSTVLRHNGG